jgi:cysteine-rich repeat protein
MSQGCTSRGCTRYLGSMTRASRMLHGLIALAVLALACKSSRPSNDAGSGSGGDGPGSITLNCPLPAPGPTAPAACESSWYVCDNGTWRLVVSLRVCTEAATSLCGNGLLDPGEECDDGNRVGSDGCGTMCQMEANWSCPVAGEFCQRPPPCGEAGVSSADGVDAGNACAVARQGTCGDGILDGDQGEECDLGGFNGDETHLVGSPPYYCTKDCVVITIMF